MEVVRGVNVRQALTPLSEDALDCPFCKFGSLRMEKGSSCARCRAHVWIVTKIEACTGGTTSGSRR